MLLNMLGLCVLALTVWASFALDCNFIAGKLPHNISAFLNTDTYPIPEQLWVHTVRTTANISSILSLMLATKVKEDPANISHLCFSLSSEENPNKVHTLLEQIRARLCSLSGVGSVAGIRRQILGSLVLRKMRFGMDESSEALTASILHRLYSLHIEAAARKRAIEFIHVSKSGGTSVCQLAERNGCKTESFTIKQTCQILAFDDEPRYVDNVFHASLRPPKRRTRCDRMAKAMKLRTAEVDCAQRYRLLVEKGYNIYANEYTSLGGRSTPHHAHVCHREMVTVLQLRHPIERIRSQIKHMWYMYRVYCRRDRSLYFRYGRKSSVWSGILPAPLNNYLVRSLGGEFVFNLPLGGVTEEHAAVAREVLLNQFDVLLVLEDAQLTDAALAYGLGWAERKLHVNAAATRAWRTNESLPGDAEALLAPNKLDIDLFNFGVMAAQMDGILYTAAKAFRMHGGDSVLSRPARTLHAREYAPPSILTPSQREVVRCGHIGQKVE